MASFCTCATGTRHFAGQCYAQIEAHADTIDNIYYNAPGALVYIIYADTMQQARFGRVIQLFTYTKCESIAAIFVMVILRSIFLS